MKLKELRKEKKITQTEIANYLQISQNTYSRYELGQIEPGIDILKKIANYFNVSLDYLCDNKKTNAIYLFTNDERDLLDNYLQLNEINKIKANSYILGLLANQ